MVFVYFGLSKLEKLFSLNRYADLFYLILFNALCLILAAYFMDEFLMAKGLSFSFLYIWSKRQPFEKVQFMFGFIFDSTFIIEIYILLIRRIPTLRDPRLPDHHRDRHLPGTRRTSNWTPLCRPQRYTPQFT